MGPLRAAFAASGIDAVATYINSGNAVGRSRLSRAEIVAVAADVCRRQFGFDKAVFALTRREWSAVVGGCPFADAAADTPRLVHAAVLAARPAADVAGLRALAGPGEGLAVVGKVAYLHTPGGFGTSRLAAKFDKGIGFTNTARNWNTVLALRDLAARVAAGE